MIVVDKGQKQTHIYTHKMLKTILDTGHTADSVLIFSDISYPFILGLQEISPNTAHILDSSGGTDYT